MSCSSTAYGSQGVNRLQALAAMALLELLSGCAVRQQQSVQGAPFIPAAIPTVIPAAIIDPDAGLGRVKPGATLQGSAVSPQLEVRDDSAVDSTPIQAP